MSTIFNLRREANGDISVNDNNQALVTGTDPGEMAWLSMDQLWEIKRKEIVEDYVETISNVIDEQIERDPVFQEFKKAKQRLEDSRPKSPLPDAVQRTVIRPDVPGTAAQPGECIEHTHDTKVILMLNAGITSRLVWDVSQKNAKKIQII